MLEGRELGYSLQEAAINPPCLGAGCLLDGENLWCVRGGWGLQVFFGESKKGGQ